MVHQRIPVENAFSHLDDIQIMVPQGHTIPQYGAISRLIGLFITILTNNILNSVQFTSAVVGVDHYLLPFEFALFVAVH